MEVWIDKDILNDFKSKNKNLSRAVRYLIEHYLLQDDVETDRIMEKRDLTNKVRVSIYINESMWNSLKVKCSKNSTYCSHIIEELMS